MKNRLQKKEIVRPITAEANKTLQIVICLFLVMATLAVYWQLQDNLFLNYDDPKYVTENLQVKAGLTPESVIWAFTTSHFSNWHPLTWLSHMLDYQMYGSHPKGHHLTSLLFHMANALLLFMVLFRMTGALWKSGFVAILFALHPLNVESVAWVAERKNVLSTFFWLLTMQAYIHYVERPSVLRYGLTVLLFALGLMSKPMLVTLSFVLLMMDCWPLRRLELEQEEKDHNGISRELPDKRLNIRRLAWEKIPLFLLAAASSVTTFIVQKSGGALQSMEVNSLSARFNNAMVSYLEYVKKTLWPEGLAVFYPHPGNALAVWKGILCGMALVGITTISLRFIKKAPYFAFGWFWYLGTMVPAIQIVQTGSHGMADRYMYIPVIGIFITIAWGLPDLLAKWRYREKALSISTGILISALMMISWIQVSHWKDSVTLFKHAIKVTSNNYPGFALIHNNLGHALITERKTEEAIAHYKMAIELDPYDATQHFNLAHALVSERRREEAISHYKLAIKLKPDYAEACFNLGQALFNEGQNEEAIFYYKKTIQLRPGLAGAHNNLGFALFKDQKTEEAISHYKMAIKLKPDYAIAHNNLKKAQLRSKIKG